VNKTQPNQNHSSDEAENSSFSLVEAELKVLQFWERKGVFRQSLEATADCPPYVFYDGPPFATGLPHHGHFVASTIKDVVPRYWTMQGFHVKRRFGWDCHGLPIEYEIDKKLGMTTSQAVERFGVSGYNDHCRSIVQRYTQEWRRSITRLGRWVDFDNDYKTMDADFMESVWWVFRQLWDKGLVYRGFKVVPVSTALATVLSNFEANANYQQTQDPSITVLFKLVDEDAWLMAWTTTPWTLPSNLAICAGGDVDYVRVRDLDLEIVCYLAESRLAAYSNRHRLEVLSRCKGRDLLGRRYEPLFPYFARYSDSGHFVVVNDDYVTADSGTGLVHIAPAFGADDHRIAKETGLDALVCPVSMSGVFDAEVSDFAGRYVKDADAEITRYLKQHKTLYEQDVIEHSYPFCYRSDTPLIYRAIDSWYVSVSAFKERIIRANEQVHWVPEHIKQGRFGNWLKEARDWAVSRNRVWGTPLPVWVNNQTGKAKCFGSVEDLQKVSGAELTDLHREHVDSIEFSVPGEEGVYSRVPEVFDCWFESGSMPYAQEHYPFENRAGFEAGYPAEFIAEGLDQTRGWFYTLMVLSTALFDKPAFRNVIVNGMVMAKDGKKMSKRLRNYTSPETLMAEYGADALRLYLISGNLLKGEEQRFSDKGVREMARRVLLPWYNAWKFLRTYITVDGWTPENPPNQGYSVLDRWLTSRLQTLKLRVKAEMEAYRLYGVAPLLFDFIEDLTNWYIRLNRSRFWGEDMTAEKLTAYSTLHRVIHEFGRIMAPFAPFMAETIYRQMLDLSSEDVSERVESVHLCRFPDSHSELMQPALEEAVSQMQQVVLLGRQERERLGIHLRLPLGRLTVIHKSRKLLDSIASLKEILKKELNVKEVAFDDDEDAFVEYYAKPNFPLLGKRLGRRMKGFQQTISRLSADDIQQLLQTGQLTLEGEVFTDREIAVLRRAKTQGACVTNQYISIVLDGTLSPELVEEGHARELVRLIQHTRKFTGCAVTDRISLLYQADSALAKVIANHRQYICGETLTAEASSHTFEQSEETFDHWIDGHSIRFQISPVTKSAD